MTPHMRTMTNHPSQAKTAGGLQAAGAAWWGILLLALMLLLAPLAASAQKVRSVPVPSDWWVHITNNKADLVERMLVRGVDPNARNSEGLPGIMLAVRESAWDVFDLLLRSRRLDPNAENAHQETPLMYVALVGDTARARALIRKGAQVNRLGWTPLQYAASTGQQAMIKLLLEQGALVNAPGPNGETALMMAALAGNEAVVRQLLLAGADATTRDLGGHDSAAWARRRGHEGLALKLDDLSRRMWDRRDAMQREADKVRTFPVPGPDAPANATPEATADGSFQGVGATTHAVTPQDGAAAAQATGQAPVAGMETDEPLPDGDAPQAKAPAKAAGGTYFDLNRFDNPEGNPLP